MKNERLVIVGQILKPHGIKGESKIKMLTDNPEYFFDFESVYIQDPQEKKDLIEVEIESARFNKEALLLKVDIIETPEDVKRYRGYFIKVPKSWLKEPEEGEYYVFDLIGIEVYTTSNELIGNITKVFPAGNTDIYEVKHPKTKKVNLIPAHKEFIKSVEIENKKMLVEPIEGLLDF